MKKLRFFNWCLLVAVSLFTLTSCFNDDDDNDNGVPTAAERAQMFNVVKGNYNGKLYSYQTNSQTGKTEKKDSAEVTCSINTDSTMVFSNVPSRLLALAIDTTTAAHKAIRKAVAAQAPAEVKCYISFYKYYQDWTGYPFWFIYPTSVTYNVSVDGTSHKVIIGFWTNSSSSYGVMQASAKKVSTQILLAGATIDGETSSVTISNAIPLVFTTK